MSFLKNTGKMIALLSLVIVLSGCAGAQTVAPTEADSASQMDPTADTVALRTEVAQTVIANITAEAAKNPSATMLPPSQTPLPVFTATIAQPTAVVQASVTPVATKNSGSTWKVYPTFTRTPYTDAAEFVGQEPRDGFSIGAGGDFDIVWTFKNVGLRPWNTSFYLRYLSGEKGSDATKYMLSAPVAVGDTISIRVDMVAPTQSGSYTTTWQLINDDGVAILTPYLSFTVE